jgi:hypothetical protein
MPAKYCYWSVATGPYAELMVNCVRTARRAGVFRDFHVLTDRALEGCECYDAMECDKTDGLFKLHYLKVGMSRLPYDYFIWIDADSVFNRNPIDILAPLGKSPIHVPLEVNLAALTEDRQWKGVSCFKWLNLFRDKGISNPPYLSRSAFWIVHREAIEAVYDLAMRFSNEERQASDVSATDGANSIDSDIQFRNQVDVDAALGYAMQILCADSEAHRLECHPEVWASYVGHVAPQSPLIQTWSWHNELSDRSIQVRPAIVHLGNRHRRSEAAGLMRN